jgi:hypothetical protein
MLYAFGVGGAMLGGMISADRAWILMALPCLAPMIWCAAGFLRGLGTTSDGGEQDAGLLLSAIGWALIAGALVAKYFAVIAAQPDAYASQATSPITPLCAGLGILCLLMGAAISWFSWKRETD